MDRALSAATRSTECRTAAFSASSRHFDLNGKANRISKRHNRAIIAADVRRFGHVINTDGVLGTHRARRTKNLDALLPVLYLRGVNYLQSFENSMYEVHVAFTHQPRRSHAKVSVDLPIITAEETDWPKEGGPQVRRLRPDWRGHGIIGLAAKVVGCGNARLADRGFAPSPFASEAVIE